ncbi:hypothetical protein CBER1_09718 [Cercospora berteroae]|uniref:Uncharacterized protein n=1 Tax=Cercospora berteroae TaxID=357750 RepID=A0A2S6CDX9_9PEZI|nr:hypothetical protein CBER1_09718 [Cercospora berteroae]
MGIDPLGAALGSASLFFVLYDTCGRLYQGCQDVKYFGRDVILESMKLRSLMSDLDIIMDTKATDMQEPPDLDDVEHRVTKEIIIHLRIISTYFGLCHDIIQAALKISRGIPFTVESTMLKSSYSTHGVSEISFDSSDPQPSKTTRPNSITGKSRKHLRVPSFFARRSSKKKSDVRADSPLDQTIDQGSSDTVGVAVSSPPKLSSTSGLKVPVVHAVSSEDTKIFALRFTISATTSSCGGPYILAIESGSEPLEGAEVKVIGDMSAVRCPKPTELVGSDRYVRCGNFTAQPGDKFHHEIFAELRPWQCVHSLSEYLDDSASAALLSLEVIVKLFGTIPLAYLDFEKLRSSCRYPRVEDYRTYRRPLYTNDPVLMQHPANSHGTIHIGPAGLVRRVPFVFLARLGK